MKSGKPDADAGHALRKGAEERIKKRRATPASRDPEHLLHELEVHQVELEMQNDELRVAQNEASSILSRYTELFDFAPVGYAVLSADTGIKELNFVAAHMLGAERGRLMGRYLRSFIKEGERAVFTEAIANLLARPDNSRIVHESILEGYERRYNVRLSMLLRPDGEKPSVLVAIEDITAEKRARSALEEADRRKDEFIAVLSHELRNPMMAIAMGAAIARHRDTSPESAERAFAIIDRQVNGFRRLVEDLLDVSRLAHGKIMLKVEPLDLRECVISAIEDLRPSIELKGLELDCRITLDPLWVDGDAVRLNQVVANLLGNSTKFTPSGGVIAIKLQSTGPNFAELHINDTGRGMTTGELEHAFEPFSQASQAGDRSLGGLGLGLPIVKQLVELHGGGVHLASGGRDRGTYIVVRLPLRSAPAQALTEPRAEAVPSHRVLVIEDNVDGAEALAEVLGLIGQEAAMAYDGPSGIARARDFQPEVVFCDIGLPEMDGYAVARAFRADSHLKRVFLIALTGYAAPSDIDRATAAGFDRHLAKPVNLEDLKQVLAAVPSARYRRAPSATGLK